MVFPTALARLFAISLTTLAVLPASQAAAAVGYAREWTSPNAAADGDGYNSSYADSASQSFPDFTVQCANSCNSAASCAFFNVYQEASVPPTMNICVLWNTDKPASSATNTINSGKPITNSNGYRKTPNTNPDPAGYRLEWSSADAAADGSGYISSYASLNSVFYNDLLTECAASCRSTASCVFFNIYQESQGSQPANICVLWDQNKPSSSATNTFNNGRPVSNSGGYFASLDATTTASTTTTATSTSTTSASSDAPTVSATEYTIEWTSPDAAADGPGYIRSYVSSTTTFDSLASDCANACTADTSCAFFNVYQELQNEPPANICVLWNQNKPSSTATNTFNNGRVISNSAGYLKNVGGAMTTISTASDTSSTTSSAAATLSTESTSTSAVEMTLTSTTTPTSTVATTTISQTLSAPGPTITSASAPELSDGTIITFEDLPLQSSRSITINGVTFSGNMPIFISSVYAGEYNTRGAQYLDNDVRATELTFTFTTTVSAFGFSWGASDEDWLLSAYDVNDRLISSFVLPKTRSDNEGNFYGLKGIGISYATLKIESGDDWVFLDNFIYREDSSIDTTLTTQPTSTTQTISAAELTSSTETLSTTVINDSASTAEPTSTAESFSSRESTSTGMSASTLTAVSTSSVESASSTQTTITSTEGPQPTVPAAGYTIEWTSLNAAADGAFFIRDITTEAGTYKDIVNTCAGACNVESTCAFFNTYTDMAAGGSPAQYVCVLWSQDKPVESATNINNNGRPIMRSVGYLKSVSASFTTTSTSTTTDASSNLTTLVTSTSTDASSTSSISATSTTTGEALTSTTSATSTTTDLSSTTSITTTSSTIFVPTTLSTSTILVSTTSTSSTDPQVTQLVVNGGFESASAMPWTLTGYFSYVSGENPDSGEFSFGSGAGLWDGKIEIPSLSQQISGLVPDQYYRVRYYAQGSSVCTLTGRVNGVDGRLSFLSTFYSVYGFTFQATATTVLLSFEFQCTGDIVPVWIDNITLGPARVIIARPN